MGYNNGKYPKGAVFFTMIPVYVPEARQIPVVQRRKLTIFAESLSN